MFTKMICQQRNALFIPVVLPVVLIVTILLFYPAASCFAVMADDGQQLLGKKVEGSSFSFGAGLSLLLHNAEGKEYVYADEEVAQEVGQPIAGDKISDLRWQTKNAQLVGVNVSAAYKHFFSLNLGYWGKVSAGNGRHTDDDWMIWLNGGQALQTNYSEGRSELKTGNIFDMNGKINVLPSWDSPFQVHGLLGYKKMHWGWKEHDSYGIYFFPNDDSRLIGGDDVVGATGDGIVWQSTGVGITYDQTISIPYIGLKAGYGKGAVNVEAYVLYSGWTQIEVEDHHLARSMISEGTFDDGQYLAGGANVAWNFYKKLTAVGTVEFEDLSTTKGDASTTLPVNENGDMGTFEADEGAAYNGVSFMLNIIYPF